MTNTVKHEKIIEVMENFSPVKLAYDWDNVGLQIGHLQDVTQKVLVTLDVTEGVVDEAIQVGANLIIAHHPLIFKPIKQINRNDRKGQIIEKLIKNDITVCAAHTNLDITNGGVNDMLCNELQVKRTKPLITTNKEKLYKLVVFVPESHVTHVQHALGDTGAGNIGNYSHCAFIGEGVGTFRPNKDANPHVGKQDEQHEEKEKRIEVIVSENNLQQVLAKMLQVHPYEEPAYDILLLEQSGEKLGLGRVGTIDQTITVKDLCDMIKQRFTLSHVRISGDLSKQVKKIAIVGGSGEKFVQAAQNSGADVYITGDMTYHVTQDAEQAGMTIIDAGHIIEKVMISYMTDYLQKEFPHKEIIASTINTDPFQYY